MLDVNRVFISVTDIVAAVGANKTGVRVLRQPNDLSIDQLRDRIQVEALLAGVNVSIDHIDVDVLQVIPRRRRPTSAEVYRAMNRPPDW